MLPRLLRVSAARLFFTSRRLPSHLTCSPTPDASSRRLYAALVTSQPRCEQVSVPCRSNGSIKIDIFHSAIAGAPVLLYLPSGPVVPDRAEEEERIISTLLRSSGATIARINYRASSVHQYPTPVHDVLTGYDWVLENLDGGALSRPFLARLGVCGELVGGSLATMLALTECGSSKSRIVAASVNNPIVDWVFADDMPIIAPSELPEPPAPEETSFPAEEDPMSSFSQQTETDTAVSKKHRKRTPKPPQPTAWQLYGDNPIIPSLTLSGERDVLFRKPEDYFDRFASPLHFFRSPHATLIYPRDDDAYASQQPDGHLDVEAQRVLSHYQSLEESSSAPDLPTLARCRAYARIYPQAGTNLSLPVWHITTGSQSPLMDQACELTKMIRRSIARQTLRNRTGRRRWHDNDEKEQYEEYAETRVNLNKVEGVGLWTEQDNNNNWKSQVNEIGMWMKRSLDPGFM